MTSDPCVFSDLQMLAAKLWNEGKIHTGKDVLILFDKKDEIQHLDDDALGGSMIQILDSLQHAAELNILGSVAVITKKKNKVKIIYTSPIQSYETFALVNVGVDTQSECFDVWKTSTNILDRVFKTVKCNIH